MNWQEKNMFEISVEKYFKLSPRTAKGTKVTYVFWKTNSSAETFSPAYKLKKNTFVKNGNNNIREMSNAEITHFGFSIINLWTPLMPRTS